MMRLMVAAGATGIIMLWSWPAEAAQRDEDTRGFCQGAPDLCVFVCRGGCAGMSSDYICESRRGRLVVLEGGEQSYFEEDFSLCWHRSRPPDEPLPDPEDKHVPSWPGSDDGAMCMGCDRGLEWCRNGAVEHIDVCVKEHEAIYSHICKVSQRKHGIPRGRNSKEVDTSFTCAVLLEKDEKERRRRNGASQTREGSPRFKECLRKALDACLADYRDDHPDDSSEDKWVIGLDKIVKTEYTTGKVLRWGGKVGYESACNQSGVMITQSCIEARTECARKADPKFSCAREGSDR